MFDETETPTTETLTTETPAPATAPATTEAPAPATTIQEGPGEPVHEEKVAEEPAQAAETEWVKCTACNTNFLNARGDGLCPACLAQTSAQTKLE